MAKTARIYRRKHSDKTHWCIRYDLNKEYLMPYTAGEILCFRDRIITRIYPPADVSDFEPNYFPFIEFTDSDFPWRFTATTPESDGKLNPWITLVVLVSENHSEETSMEFEFLPSTNRGLPPAIKVYDSNNLPDLDFAWRWAHTHVTNQNGKENELGNSIRNEPKQIICRLICPRKLAPDVKYRVFLVPTFEIERRAGRGEFLDNKDINEIAWVKSAGDEIELPYYFSWEFRTVQL